MRLCFACIQYIGGITLNDMTPGDLQFNEFLNRRLYSIGKISNRLADFQTEPFYLKIEQLRNNKILISGQLLFNINLSETQNIVTAINSLSRVDFDQITIPAIGQTYDVDRKIFHYIPKRNHQMTIRMIQQILDKAETTGALRDDFASGQF